MAKRIRGLELSEGQKDAIEIAVLRDFQDYVSFFLMEARVTDLDHSLEEELFDRPSSKEDRDRFTYSELFSEVCDHLFLGRAIMRLPASGSHRVVDYQFYLKK